MARSELVIGKVRGDDGHGVNPGGTTGQALVKVSAVDYDTTWRTLPLTVNTQGPDSAGNVTINTGVMTVNDTAPTNGNVNVDTGVMTVNSISPTNGNVNVNVGVTNVAYDTTNKKFTKTTESGTTDIVAVSALKTDMDLANVDNTSDANKPISTATQTALNAKADKTAVVSTVAYANSKITKTINGTTTDVVTAATLKSDMALNKVENKTAAEILSEIVVATNSQIDALFPPDHEE